MILLGINGRAWVCLDYDGVWESILVRRGNGVSRAFLGTYCGRKVNERLAVDTRGRLLIQENTDFYGVLSVHVYHSISQFRYTYTLCPDD